MNPSTTPLKERLLSRRMYPFYFVAVAFIVLVIFAISVFSYYFTYYNTIRLEKQYLKGTLKETSQYQIAQNKFDPVAGGEKAKVTIYEFTDFTCPACKNVQSELKAIDNYYGQNIKRIFKGIPITGHPESVNSMNAAYCAHEQGLFEQYKEVLFVNQSILAPTIYSEIAKGLNMNVLDFQKCFDEKKYQYIIDQNLTDAMNIQVASTPTLVINNTKEDGIFNFRYLQGLIEIEMNKAK